MRLLDLFCGRWGWSRAFAARGWECVGVDLTDPPEIPANCKFIKANVLDFWASPNGWVHRNNKFSCGWSEQFDVIVASSPCEEFSVWGMPHFFPDPPYPVSGIELFNHTRRLCHGSGLPWVMENVRAAQMFVGQSRHHCGPYHLWGLGVPVLTPQGIIKGMTRRAQGFREYKGEPGWGKRLEGLTKRNDKESAAKAATIPPELAHCVAEYAEILLEQKKVAVGGEGDSVAP